MAKKFSSPVQCCDFRFVNYVPFFIGTQVADSCDWAERWSSPYNFPVNSVVLTAVFEIPNVAGQGSFGSSSWLPKFCLWAPYLFLKVFTVRPTYFWTSLPALTVAPYTTLSMVHLPGSGHFVGSWQVHLEGGSFLVWFKILKLCFANCAFKLGRHLYDSLTFLLLRRG